MLKKSKGNSSSSSSSSNSNSNNSSNSSSSSSSSGGHNAVVKTRVPAVLQSLTEEDSSGGFEASSSSGAGGGGGGGKPPLYSTTVWRQRVDAWSDFTLAFVRQGRHHRRRRRVANLAPLKRKTKKPISRPVLVGWIKKTKKNQLPTVTFLFFRFYYFHPKSYWRSIDEEKPPTKKKHAAH